jgi:hypothetical protein
MTTSVVPLLGTLPLLQFDGVDHDPLLPPVHVTVVAALYVKFVVGDSPPGASTLRATVPVA